jgi:hypothetical protein
MPLSAESFDGSFCIGAAAASAQRSRALNQILKPARAWHHA